MKDKLIQDKKNVIEEKLWNDFAFHCKNKGSNIAEELKLMIEHYLEGEDE